MNIPADDARFELDLRYAAARGQIVPLFRPVVDLQTGAVAGFAALAHWVHPGRGLLAPEQFLPLAEHLDLVADLERWVLEKTCEEVASWGGEAVDALAFVLARCSAPTVRGPGLADHARAAADVAGLPPDRLVLELPQDDLDGPVAAEIRWNGIGVAAGGPETTSSSLRPVAVDTLSVIPDLGAFPDTRALIEATTAIGHERAVRVIVRGIETSGQLRALRAAGVPYGQGGLFTPPVGSAEARALLASPPWAADWRPWQAGTVAV